MAKLSRADFMELVADLIGKRFPLIKLEKSEGDFALRLNGAWARLENLYRSCMQQGDDVTHLVERWVTEMLRASEGSPDQTASYEELKHRILPMVLSAAPRDRSGPAMVTQQLVDGLTVGYAVDSEHTIAYIPKVTFESWNITIDQLHETSIANLVTHSEDLPANAAADDNGRIALIVVQTKDGYDASRILLPDLHDRLREHLGSPFLCGVPNRDILLCFRNEPELLERMTRQIAEDYQTMPHQVSNRLFLLTPDGIAPYQP
jgi:uncharacterized protein YtpQ (UPF0354 family)